MKKNKQKFLSATSIPTPTPISSRHAELVSASIQLAVIFKDLIIKKSMRKKE